MTSYRTTTRTPNRQSAARTIAITQMPWTNSQMLNQLNLSCIKENHSQVQPLRKISQWLNNRISSNRCLHCLQEKERSWPLVPSRVSLQKGPRITSIKASSCLKFHLTIRIKWTLVYLLWKKHSRLIRVNLPKTWHSSAILTKLSKRNLSKMLLRQLE